MYWIDPKHWVDLLKLKWLHFYFVLAIECPGMVIDPLFHFWPLRFRDYSVRMGLSRNFGTEQSVRRYLWKITQGFPPRWIFESLLPSFRCENGTELAYYGYDDSTSVYCREGSFKGSYACVRIVTSSFAYLQKEWPGKSKTKEYLSLGTHSLQIESVIDELVCICEAGLPLEGAGVAFEKAMQHEGFGEAQEHMWKAASLLGIQTEEGVYKRRSGKTTRMAADIIKKYAIIELPSTCSICQQPSTFHCSRCGKEKYCGPVCQTAAWPTHKQNCKK